MISFYEKNKDTLIDLTKDENKQFSVGDKWTRLNVALLFNVPKSNVYDWVKNKESIIKNPLKRKRTVGGGRKPKTILPEKVSKIKKYVKIMRKQFPI